MSAPKSWVYFIQEGTDGPIKIGYTASNPRSRMLTLQTGNAKPLRLLTCAPGTIEDERKLHEKFAKLRMTGEWFQPDPSLLGFVHGVEWSERGSAVPDPAEFAPNAGEHLQEQIAFVRGMIDAKFGLYHAECVRRALDVLTPDEVPPKLLLPKWLLRACYEAKGALRWATWGENDDETYKEGANEYLDGIVGESLALVERALSAHDAALKEAPQATTGKASN